MSSIPIPETTLSSRAMLCTLSIAQWSASKHDRQASEEIAAHHGAHPHVGRYNKLLIPKETLAEVRRIVGEARRKHYFMTLPWDDNGYRVLPAAVYMEHTEELREYSRQFMSAVEVFWGAIRAIGSRVPLSSERPVSSGRLPETEGNPRQVRLRSQR